MTTAVAVLILILLLLGPLIFPVIERQLEVYCLVLGLIAATVARQWSRELVLGAARAPIAVTVAVVVAGLVFARSRLILEGGFARIRQAVSRSWLTAIAVVTIGLASSLITAIVGALLLVEAVGMLQLGPPARNQVIVTGCFAIGIGSALTPAGGPFSAIVAQGLKLQFFDLWWLLGPWLLPGVAMLGVAAAWFARGDYDLIAEASSAGESIADIILRAAKVFAFVAGLALIGAVYAPLAARWVPHFGLGLLYWGNTLSAALDNSTLAAIEAHGLSPLRMRPALLSMVISGGMLIPGNIPNILCAGILGIRSLEWARIGIPIGVIGLGICFAIILAGGA